MKKLHKILALMAVMSMATILTGCGGGDESGDSTSAPAGQKLTPVNTGTAVYAPSTLSGRTYTITAPSGASSIRFPSGSTYELTKNGVTESGTFVASRENDTYTVRATPNNNPANVTTLQLTFTSASGGTFHITHPNGHQESGSFALSAGGGGTSGGTDGGTNGGTNGGTDGGTNGGTNGGTDGGTNGGTNGGTDGGTNTNGGTNGGTTGTAPAGLDQRIVRFILANGPFAGSNYTEQFAGGTSGNFNIIAGSEGAGTFTYTPTGSSATLVQNYTAPPQAAADGDFDNFTLTFTSATGGTLSGTQKTGNVEHPGVTGTFQFEN